MIFWIMYQMKSSRKPVRRMDNQYYVGLVL